MANQGIGRTPDLRDPTVRLAELVGVLALGQDNAFGQPLESQLRSTLIATWLAESLDLPTAERATTYWVALLRYIGCTGHAHEVATLFGDEIETRARTLAYDAANPFDVLRDALGHAKPTQRGIARIGAIVSLLAGGRRFATMNYRTGCEVADMLVERLGMDDDVRAALRCTFERWNGKGLPDGVAGPAIPRPMRIVHLAQDVEVLSRLRSPADALETAGRRSGRTYDPALVAGLAAVADDVFARLDKVDPWDAVLEAEPAPHRVLRGDALDAALTLTADFVDIKSPYTAGHSRGVADLAAEACAHAGLSDTDVRDARRAGLVHDLGRTAVPNSIWDKPSPLTRAERDRVQLHPLLTEQMLRRAPALDALNPIAACHHERADGTGYVKGLGAAQLSAAARIVAAADRYQAMTQPRAHRPALTPAAAATELRRMAGDGEIDPHATECVLAAAGHRASTARPARPRGLTSREVDVLRLLALGLTTRQIAERLVISPKTADSHIQHIYTKIGTSTRGAAALFAVQHDLLG